MTYVEYRPIEGFPGYRVGSDGSVWSCLKRIGLGNGGGTRSVVSNAWKQLKLDLNKYGYLMVSLRKDGKTIHRSVHRLILEAFIGPCPEGFETCHGDGDRSNNKLTNIRWDTKKSNYADQVSHGTFQHGERHGNAKLTAGDVKDIRERRKNGETYDAIASAFGVDRSNICCIIKGRTWTHVL